jgi:hypothetical protein
MLGSGPRSSNPATPSLRAPGATGKEAAIADFELDLIRSSRVIVRGVR